MAGQVVSEGFIWACRLRAISLIVAAIICLIVSIMLANVFFSSTNNASASTSKKPSQSSTGWMCLLFTVAGVGCAWYAVLLLTNKGFCKGQMLNSILMSPYATLGAFV